MIWVFKGICLRKLIKIKTQFLAPFHFRRLNLSLMSCSPAEPISDSIEQSKFQFNKLYLQTVKKGNRVPLFIVKEQSGKLFTII